MQEEEPGELRARCGSALRKKIKDAAEVSERSMSAEITYRLRKSFESGETIRTTSPT
jgi:hypothetical protein